MPVTTAFRAKEALYQALSADPELTHTEVRYGYVSGPRPRREIWVGEIEWVSEEPAGASSRTRTEEYRIVVTIEVHEPGNDQRESNDLAEQMMERLETILRDPRVLGIPNIIAVGIEPQLLGEGADSEGRGSIIVTQVRVVARK